jgi:hypothetical protein
MAEMINPVADLAGVALTRQTVDRTRTAVAVARHWGGKPEKLIADQSKLDTFTKRHNRHSKWDRPSAFGMPFVPPQREENDSFKAPSIVCLKGDPKYQAASIRRPECELKLLGFGFVAAQDASRRLARLSSIEADWHLIDQEDEVKGVFHDAKPGVFARLRDPLEAVSAECIGAAADRPAVVADFMRSERNGIAASVGQKARAALQPLSC